jgi:hypothetical protein
MVWRALQGEASMSIIQLVAPALAGALFNDKAPTEGKKPREIFVGKGEKANVVMSGYVGAADVKDGDDWVAGDYGRLNVRVAHAGDGDKTRLVLELDGGLRGVLFRNTEDGKNYDYVGNIDAGNGNEYVLFGRDVDGAQGPFIGLSSSALKVKEAKKK